MEYINIKAVLLAAVANLAIGFLWYNPKTFANAWMKESGVTEEKLKSGNMLVVFGVSFLLACMLAFSLVPLTVHQMALESIVNHQLTGTDPAAKATAMADVAAFKAKYGNEFRDFKHGAVHGLIYSIFLILPVIGINGLFERKSWKYIFINVGFWTLSMVIMGGIICSMS